MKKVLILASVASMIDQFNLQNIKLLQEMNYEVHVACNFKKGNTCSDEKINALKKYLNSTNVSYFQIDFERNVFKINGNLRAYKETARILKNNKYDFLHCHTPIGGVCGRLAGKKTKTKVIYTAHGFHFHKGGSIINWILYYPVEKWLARYTDVLITINKEDFNRAKKNFRAKKIEYIPGVGIDIKKFENLKVDKALEKQKLYLPEDSFVLLSVGELNKNKNHEVIIRAMKKLNNEKIHYLICGKGKLKKYLKNLAEDLGVGRNVHLLGYREDIPKIYKISDIFLFPSKREGLSVALMEAMAVALPVVCSKIRGNVDLIQENKSGYLCDPKDISKFSREITKLSNNPRLCLEMGNFNTDKVKRFDVKNVKKEMKKIYEDLELITGEATDGKSIKSTSCT